MNSAVSDSAPPGAPRTLCAAVDMPDVVRPAPTARCDAAQPTSMVHGLASASSRCEIACPHHPSAEGYPVIRVYDNARPAAVTEPLPDLVNVHRPPAASSSAYDRPPTSVIYHASAVNHCRPQPLASAVHSPTRHLVRGTIIHPHYSTHDDDDEIAYFSLR